MRCTTDRALRWTPVTCLSLAVACAPEQQETGLDADSGALWTEPCPMGESEQRMLSVGEISLNVACRGQGPTVVLLHGFPEWHRAWVPVMDLLEQDFRLIAPDQRGYNLSDKPDDVSDYALPLLTEDIVTLLDMVSEDPVIVVAHDWGGPVGWMVAHTPAANIRGLVATNGPHPVRFAQLIEDDPEQASAAAYMDYFRSENAENLLTPELVVSWLDFLSEDERALYLEALSQPGAITGGLNWYRANSLEPEVMAAYLQERSETVPVPVSVLWGEDDDAVLVQNAEGLEPWVPDLEVQTFTGVDHWIEHRIPDEVAAAIRAMDTRAQ